MEGSSTLSNWRRYDNFPFVPKRLSFLKVCLKGVLSFLKAFEGIPILCLGGSYPFLRVSYPLLRHVLRDSYPFLRPLKGFLSFFKAFLRMPIPFQGLLRRIRLKLRSSPALPSLREIPAWSTYDPG